MRLNLKYFLFAVSLILFFGPKRPCYAAPHEADLRSKSVQMHARFNCAVNSSTHVVLVSLSSSTVWPNPTNETGFINITNMYIQTDKLAASSATVKLGVINAINPSTGSVTWFFVNASSRNVSNSQNTSFFETDNSFRCLKVIAPAANSGLDGTTPYLISNEVLSGSTIYQTDVVLPSVNVINGNNANILPGLGDVVMNIVNQDPANAIEVYVDLIYHYDTK